MQKFIQLGFGAGRKLRKESLYSEALFGQSQSDRIRRQILSLRTLELDCVVIVGPFQSLFIQLARQWYVRDAAYKLDQDGQLRDMSHAPFEEPVIPSETADPKAIAARKRLRATIDKLNPAGGILDQGDGTGRHAGRKK